MGRLFDNVMLRARAHKVLFAEALMPWESEGGMRPPAFRTTHFDSIRQICSSKSHTQSIARTRVVRLSNDCGRICDTKSGQYLVHTRLIHFSYISVFVVLFGRSFPPRIKPRFALFQHLHSSV